VVATGAETVATRSRGVGARTSETESGGRPIVDMTDASQAPTVGVADNPITHSAEDLLQRGDAATALAESLRYVDASQGYVVSILGPWDPGNPENVLR
jgi:hypothetical protein